MDARPDRARLGRWAEAQVAAALVARGAEVVGRNVRLQRGELDLIVRVGERLWFVECKCRWRDDVGPPHRAVDRRKRRALWSAAREWVVRQGFRGDWGLLVASVLPRREGPPRIEFLRAPPPAGSA